MGRTCERDWCGIQRRDILILVTIGTKKAIFDDLFRIIDDYAPNFGDEIVLQIGLSGFEAKNCRCVSFLKEDEMQKLFDEADVIVCPIGIGTIMNGLTRQVPLVFFPEKNDLEDEFFIAGTIEKMNRGILANYDNICEKIMEARKMEIGEYRKNEELADHLSDILKSYE